MSYLTVGGELESVGADAAWAQARSALAWWLEAGVDVAVQEQSRDWLKPPETKPKPKAAPASTAPPNIVQPAHETLAELQNWLANSLQLPLASTTAKRISPHGPTEAAIMLLSDEPTLSDLTAGQPIGGEAWELTKRMLAAVSIPVDQAYSASLSCFHAPGAKLSAAERDACADIARKHIRLVRPKRLLLFGGGPTQALLGKPLPSARGHVHTIEGVRTIATFDPRDLINRSSNKSLAWKDLLLLMEGES